MRDKRRARTRQLDGRRGQTDGHADILYSTQEGTVEVGLLEKGKEEEQGISRIEKMRLINGKINKIKIQMKIAKKTMAQSGFGGLTHWGLNPSINYTSPLPRH